MSSTTGAAEAGKLLEPGDQWTIEVHRQDDITSQLSASLMALSNGYLGMRGDIGLRLDDDAERATILAGFHETWPIVHAENAYGFARVGQTLLTFPDATGFKVFVDGVRIDLDEGHIEEVDRRLDMHQGIIRSTILWRSTSGRRILFTERVAVSIVNRSLAVVELTIESVDGPAHVRITSIVEESAVEPSRPGAETLAEVTGMTDPRVGVSGSSAFLTVMSRKSKGVDGSVVFRTERSKMLAALSYTHQSWITNQDERLSIPVKVSEGHDGNGILTHFDADLEQGQALTVSKGLSYSRSEVLSSSEDKSSGTRTIAHRVQDVMNRSKEALAQYLKAGTDQFFTKQAEAFEALWVDRDIELAGDPSAQKALRWTIFHLIQASHLIEGTSVSVKGLTGTGYDGHYFWDTEIYILPFLIFTSPDSAREALHYRYLLLDAARERAKEMSQKGALFPWRTINGQEASAYYPAGTAQYHIDADVAYAVDQYARVTGDMDFLSDEGFEMLVETARLWVDLGFWDDGPKRDGEGRQFHIYGVTGPDEYTAVVDDNFYTNVMARHNLRNVLYWASWMDRNRHSDYVRLRDRLSLSDTELAEFRAVENSMHIPFDEQLGVHAQDRSFLSKPVWDFDSVPRENYPLLLNYHPLVIYRHQVLKQADVVLALYLMGDEFSLEQRRADFEYYDPLTTGDSSLSAASQAVIASDVGYSELAKDYFERALYVDLADLHGNASLGLHMASLGGVWSAVVMGFGGARLLNGQVHLSPNLPPNWESLEFRLCFDGQWITVVTRRDSMQVTLDRDAQNGFPIVIDNQPFSLVPGLTVDVVLRAAYLSVNDVDGEMGRFADLEPLDLPPVEDDHPSDTDTSRTWSTQPYNRY